MNKNNHYHKIFFSCIFGFNDFSILYIQGKYTELLKGTYETFSQLFCEQLPEQLWGELFIVWEGFISKQQMPDHKFILNYDGNLRKLKIDELKHFNKQLDLCPQA